MGKDDLLFSGSTTPNPKDSQEPQAQPAHKPWKLLVVDDESEVHSTTRLVLNDFDFEGGRLKFLSAHSGDEAIAILREHPDVAVVLLDVVMETPHAGLDCARAIRQELGMENVRIVLRTGQPGQAPEREVIVEYDINDYKHKSELSAQRLFSTVYTAIRSYRDMLSLDKQRKGLEYIIDASADFFKQQSINMLIKGVLTQIEAMFRLDDSLFLSAGKGFAALAQSPDQDWQLVAGTGKYDECGTLGKCEHVEGELLQQLQEVVASRRSAFVGNNFVGYFPTQKDTHHILYLEDCKNDDWKELNKLVTIFTNNVGIALDNAYLNEEIQETQIELLYRLGDLVETRSKETAYHVQRVAEYSYIIGRAAGLDEADALLLKRASPMHDIGKIGIPDSILLKPGKLTPEEFEVMKTHAAIGYNIFRNSKRPLLKLAANVAHAHHERWDGTGYPQGLAGEDIPLEGRITNLVDVFDALGSERVYKKAWPLEDVLALIDNEKGTIFDPTLVELLHENLDKILDIRNRYVDKGA